MKWPADNRSSETVGRVLRLRNTLPALVVSAALALLASCAGQPSSSSGGSPEITQQPVSQTVLAGHSATFTVSAASNSPLSYQWRKNGSNIAGANSSTYTTPPTTMADNGSRFQVMVSNPSQSTASSPATLTVDGPLSITTQPANQTVDVGQTATFTVVATGAAPLSYQWQKNQVNIAGATSASYTTPATTSADNGTSFRVIVTNPVTSVTSNAATLTVNAGPSITTQPANQTVDVGQTATFTVVATGAAPLSYQWQKNQVNIAGATSASYTTPATTSADNGTSFRVIVTNPVTSVTSNAATLTVNAGPSITTQPANQTVDVGQTATFTVVATGAAPLSYQWQKNQVNIAGATSASYTTPATTSADNGTSFRVIVTNPVTSVTSNAATLTVNAGPSITTQPANQTVNVGQTATFTVVATGAAPLSYQWQKNQVNIAGATSASYTTPATTSADNGTSFRVIVTNPVTSVTSNAATLTVNAGPSITTQPANQTVNVGQTATFTVVATGAAPLSYQWQKNQVNIAGATSASYTTPATTSADNGTSFRVIVTNPVTSVTSNAATLTVNAGPSITTQPANQTVNVGQTATFTVVATGAAPLSYQWQKNQVNIAGATSASYTTPATTSADNGTSFRVIVTNPVTSVTSNAATLTVNAGPSITTQPANQTVNVGQTATFTVVATGAAPLSYQWQKNQVNIAGATSASYTTPATTSADNGTSFRVIVTNPVTSVTSNAATLTVNAGPSITTQPANQTVDVGQTATFTVVATGAAPLSYQWQKNQVNIAGATSASYTTPATTSADNGTSFRVIVTNPITSVTSNAATLTVNAGPSVTTNRNNNQRTNVNTNETILTPANVNSASFGKLFSQSVDGYVFAQPLYVPTLAIKGAVHNVVYIATEHDSVYAFDADSSVGSNAQPLWHTNFLLPGATTVSSADVGCDDIVPEYGITGTPVIDLSTNTLYVVSDALENNGANYVKRFHALDITTGAEKPGSPIIISASVAVSGQNPVAFDTQWEHQRAGLLLYSGVVYFAFGSHCDNSDEIGWILGYSYNGSSFSQVFVFSDEPSSINGKDGGIWMAGAGLLMDSGSNMFVATGNGAFDTNLTPPVDYADSIIRIDLSQGPTVQDYFTPWDQSTEELNDLDLGSGGIALLPDQSGTNPHLLVQAGKEGVIHVVNRDKGMMGGFNASGDQIVQEITGIGGIFSSPAYFNGKIYFWGVNDVLKAFTVTNGLLSTSPTDQGPDGFGYPGANPTISASGTSNGIVWALNSGNWSKTGPGGPGVLYAYEAGNLAAGYIYNSFQNGTRDNPGGAIKFAIPTVANGKVYVGAEGQFSVYGELGPGGGTAPAITSANQTTFTVGAAGSFTVDTTGVPAPSLTETGTLPSGVTFQDNGNGSGMLSGTPAGTGGSYAVTITANNGVGTAANQSFTLTITQSSQAP